MSYIILVGLISVIILSPLAVGSVYIVTYSAMEIVVFGLLLLHIWTWRSDKDQQKSNNGEWRAEDGKGEEISEPLDNAKRRIRRSKRTYRQSLAATQSQRYNIKTRHEH